MEEVSKDVDPKGSVTTKVDEDDYLDYEQEI